MNAFLFICHMKSFQIICIAGMLTACAGSKNNSRDITEKNVTRIESTLSADDMQGRLTLTPGNEKAAAFIENEMKSIGLETWQGSADYYQKFVLKKTISSTVEGSINGTAITPSNIICISPKEYISINKNDDYKVAYVNSKVPRSILRKLFSSDSNLIILLDTSYTNNFSNLKRMQSAIFSNAANKFFILTDITDAKDFSFTVKQQLQDQSLVNVVGYLPGKSKANEYVIYSGHFDHLGIGKPDEKGDSIYNGANDDASGVTAMLSLARHYKELNNNERSLIFVAFNGEELGGYGATYFSKHINPDSVVAMFNIEMIGTESKWGKKSAYITGYDKSSFGSILQKNVAGSKFSFYPDPYTEQQLFYRSDNTTLARLGVPAHTISTSKMDSEPHYHKASDEISTLNMKNMTEVIKAIALASTSVVNAKDTPTRVSGE